MWKRERPERTDPEHTMTETPATVAPATRPVAPPPAPVVGAPSQSAAAVPSSQPSPSKGSTLGATLRFKGDLVADEDLVVQGQVEGSILHTRSLTIGAQGRMHGDIRARRIMVEGSVEGDLYALESVVLRSGATVRGDLFAPRITIDEGARLSGRIDMDNAPTVPTINIPVSGSTEPAARELTDEDAGALLSGS
jgi:cytoskeletal protein CcmA (bactofilin family)